MLTVKEGRARGRSLRDSVPLAAHRDLRLPERDPIGILEGQNSTRLASLVPVRVGRMSASPFAFYRGTAAVMAHDLSGDLTMGQDVLCCGDAHISNFGLFASPERQLLFDLNDFDESATAPWEWDVKRLAASVVLGGRDLGLDDVRCREDAQTAVRAYREALRDLYELTALERFYFRVETDSLAAASTSKQRKVVQAHARKSRERTHEQVRDKLMTVDDQGARRFRELPPTTHHVDVPSIEEVQRLFAEYRATLRSDTAYLLAQFRLVDYALRAVGVGSVGTRCYVLMFEGPAGVPLFLQVKEAPPSVLETYGRRPLVTPDGVTPPANGVQGHRVVTSQRILQAHSDPFLGWITASTDPTSPRQADYYWRQFRDMKGSVRIDRLSPAMFSDYARLCGRLLARAHSQSPGGSVVLGYLGRSERFEEAVACWSVDYADQSERDFATFEAAITSGRLAAERGV